MSSRSSTAPRNSIACANLEAPTLRRRRMGRSHLAATSRCGVSLRRLAAAAAIGRSARRNLPVSVCGPACPAISASV
jgi:hypothetical protein